MSEHFLALIWCKFNLRSSEKVATAQLQLQEKQQIRQGAKPKVLRIFPVILSKAKKVIWDLLLNYNTT